MMVVSSWGVPIPSWDGTIGKIEDVRFVFRRRLNRKIVARDLPARLWLGSPGCYPERGSHCVYCGTSPKRLECAWPCGSFGFFLRDLRKNAARARYYARMWSRGGRR